MSDAVCRARALVADMALVRAPRFAIGKVPVPLALRLAGSPVPPLTACMRIVASVPPLNTLNLEPGADGAGFQVYI